MSGVARSLNYYPIGDEQAEEGIVTWRSVWGNTLWTAA
jgi:hypothetical protein